MKKFLCALLCVLMVLTVVGCGSKNETLKFGLGVYTSTPSATDAGEADGQGKLAITVAAVSVDADGKIVACQLDTADNTAKYTAEGKAVAAEFKTKYELGNDYNMKAYAGSTFEWFEQADKFEALVCGKTVAEVKALVAEGNKGTEEVVNAGCTIMINDFVSAIEKACNNAVESNVTASHTLKLGIVTDQTCTDATEEAKGSNKLATTVFAAAVDAEGKVVAASSDCVEVTFTFDQAGVSTFDATKAILSKKEQGANYGMVAWGGATLEWFEQAAAFDKTCIGKTASEIAAFVGADGKGVEAVQTAGCTIYVTGFVKAAAKIG